MMADLQGSEVQVREAVRPVDALARVERDDVARLVRLHAVADPSLANR
jgi:hypothetical protein